MLLENNKLRQVFITLLDLENFNEGFRFVLDNNPHLIRSKLIRIKYKKYLSKQRGRNERGQRISKNLRRN